MDASRGPMGRSRQSADREREREKLGHMIFNRVLGWSASGFLGEGQIGLFNAKVWKFGKPLGGLI